VITRIITPFDGFMSDFIAWLDGAWFVWASMAAAIALVVVIVTVSKVRARARARAPQYRRSSPELSRSR
jgi:heme exporter protein D